MFVHAAALAMTTTLLSLCQSLCENNRRAFGMSYGGGSSGPSDGRGRNNTSSSTANNRNSGESTDSNEKYDYVFKFIIIGDTGTGKSCALHQFVEGKFKKGPAKHTIGVEFGSRIVSLAGKTIKLQIWDTAVSSSFSRLKSSFF